MRTWCMILLLAISGGVALAEQEIGRFGDLVAYSNGENTGTGKGLRQCVELIKRDVEAHGLAWVSIGTADKFFDVVDSEKFPGLRAYANGAQLPPMAGDILCFKKTSGNGGHVAKVTRVEKSPYNPDEGVEGYRVEILEQNWSVEQGSVTLRLHRRADGTWWMPERGNRNTYTIQGWCRYAVDVAKSNPSVHCILADESLSMAYYHPKMQRAILVYMAGLPEDDVIMLVGVSTYARVLIEPTTLREARPRLSSIVRDITSTRQTNLYEGLSWGKQLLGQCVAKQTRVLYFTNGKDTTKRTDWGIIREYRARSWRIDVFPYGDDANLDLLAQFARDTGGKVHPLNGRAK
jgi:hypothetical protein